MEAREKTVIKKVHNIADSENSPTIRTAFVAILSKKVNVNHLYYSQIQVYLYALFYRVTAIYTRTVPAELPAGTETVLRTLAIVPGCFL